MSLCERGYWNFLLTTNYLHKSNVIEKVILKNSSKNSTNTAGEYILLDWYLLTVLSTISWTLGDSLYHFTSSWATSIVAVSGFIFDVHVSNAVVRQDFEWIPRILRLHINYVL